MRLKKLEIIGFKSFAEKTSLYFHSGITAVVGPNGCGKSNISDAFRWVLGEQSAKSIRGNKMPDVIFAGTASRKPLNFAEATLTLTDINGKLPVEYEEVAITRRLHRSGESEYFINKHPVRLKDIQALFLDSGMGKDAYSIFEQGKIDQVINLSALERRYIFEEAAGILRFLQRKKEALRRLEQTDLNVSRVKDIHKEVERQIIVLEEQSEKARQYKENKQALDHLEKSLIFSKWTAMQVKFQETAAKGEAQDYQIYASNMQIETLQGQVAEAKQALEEVEKALKKQGENVYSVRSHKDLQAKEKQISQERLKDLANKEKRWQTELESAAERKSLRNEERKALLKQEKETGERLKGLEETVLVQQGKVKNSEEELSKEREKQQTKQKELFKLMQAESQCENDIRQTKVRLESAEEREHRLVERKERLSQASLELVKQVEEKQQQLETALNDTEKKKEVFISMEEILQEISLELEKTQQEMDVVHQQFSDYKARQKALQRLREEMEGFSAGSKKLLQESQNKASPLFSKVKGLYEYLIPEKGVEAALASVMRPYAQTLVVETEDDFTHVAEYIKKHEIKDVSLLCLEAISKIERKEPAIPSNKLSKLSLSVIENVLAGHFLQDAYLEKKSVSIMEVVKDYAGMQIYLKNGTFLDRQSVIFYSSQSENNVFLREAELKALEVKLQETERDKQRLEGYLKAIQQRRSQIQSERTELDKVIRKAEMNLVELNFSVHKASTDLEKMSAEDKILASDWQSVKHAINALSQSLQELHAKHKAAKELASEAQKEAEQLTIGLSKLVEGVKEQAADLRTKENTLNHVLNEQRKFAHALHVLEVKDLESIQQEGRLEEEIKIGRSLQEEIALKGSEAEKQLTEAELALRAASEICRELEQRVSLRKKALENLEIKVNEKRAALKKQETEQHQLGIQSAQLESGRQTLENELRERHQLTISEAQELHKAQGVAGLSIEHMEKQMRQLRQAIEQAGDVNMTSIEECEKHKTRYQFLNQQIDDLGSSKEELIAIIAELDDESRTIFQQTFQNVRRNFKKNFEILFSGGEADLQFTESADILEAGIEIIAKPPGKQMRSINLLSGGEKCLTAMALLFAIFEVKPSPFCILDEIDAPLDDANIERFVNIVKQFAEKCQFIIITHNKRTMAIADVMCGVSMEEKGVSKLLSMDFSKRTASEMVAL